MELVFAGLACQARNAVVDCVNYTVTNGTLFNSFKLLVKITLPYPYCFS